MKQLSKFSMHALRLGCVALLGPSSLPGAVAQSGHPVDATVVVFADQYRFEGRAFDSTEALGVAIDTVRPRSVVLNVCGSGATRAMKAAVYRLRHRPLLVAGRDMSESECAVGAMLSAATRLLRVGDEAAIESYWRDMGP